MNVPWYLRPLLLRPAPIFANLERMRAAGHVAAVPTPWQLSLGVLRLWHRVIARGDTVGTSAAPVRASWRARALVHKPLRLPALLAERAIAPLDFTGLASSPARVIRHLLGAHHDRHQFVYDLELLAHHGALPALHAQVRAVVAPGPADAARARWLRDLTVYDGYHDDLLAAVERALRDGPTAPLTAAEADDPDVSFGAYLRWCVRQPTTPAATLAAWRAGTFRFDSPLVAPASAPAPLAPPDDVTALMRASQAELAARMRAGRPVDPASLDGWVYRGVSLGLPRWALRLTWTKFAKAFARDDAGVLRGWNIRCEQDALALPWRPKQRAGAPVTFGPFAVVHGPGGVLLDYGVPGASPALRALRDPLVALDDGPTPRLLGRSLLAIGGRTIGTPSYFVLERDRPAGRAPW